MFRAVDDDDAQKIWVFDWKNDMQTSNFFEKFLDEQSCIFYENLVDFRV